MGEGTGDGDAAVARALAPIVGELARRGARSGLRQDFARAVLRRVSPAQLGTADPAAVAAAVDAAFEFVDARRPGDVRVSVADLDVSLDGGRPAGTVVQVSCEDRQFILTSVVAELQRLGHRVVRDLHPVFGSERGADGHLARIVGARTAAQRESLLQLEVAGGIEPGARPGVEHAVRSVLSDVFAATGDYDAMRTQVCDVARRVRDGGSRRFPAEEVHEAADLLEWLLDGNFVLAGSCRFPGTSEDGEDLHGVLSRPGSRMRLRPLRAAPDDVLRIARCAEVSTIHRRVPMHCVDVADIGPDGDVGGLFRLVGVFTNKGNAEPAALIPVLRFKLRRVLELEDVVERSQDEAAVIALFQVLPKDQLFEADVETLRRLVVELLAAEDLHDVRVLVRVDTSNRSVSALVSVPAELYSPVLRHRMEHFLVAQLGESRIDVDVALGDRPEAILRLVAYPDAPVDDVVAGMLERELRLLCRTWDEQLAGALEDRLGAAQGRRLAQSWADLFPVTYRDLVPAEAAIDDVLQVEALLAGAEGTGVRIVVTPDPAGGPQARVRVFSAHVDVELSRFLPILESLGLWAVEDRSYTLGGPAAPVHLHDFGVTDSAGAAVDVVGDGPRLASGALALWQGRADVDSLNRLVVSGGLTWDEVAVLRSYRRYRSQVGTAFTMGYVDQVLVEHPGIAAALVDLFAAHFDPARDATPEVVAALRRRVVDGCDAVDRLDHDRILRGFLSLVDATLRTNRYLTAGDHIALKFDSAAVPGMPRPVPFREIFVHGPAVEGVHLRWGSVARGGIRWSDRPDDYRSEVLDLMRAQVLKNAVIVPTGAKGGFVVRQPGYGKAAVNLSSAYEVFVAGLLDVTDNVVGDRVDAVPRRRDGDDTYLVVAADRGTATFSDLANNISRERGFWLDDAFASGGSSGYDHKALGITARGAWVAVQEHFAGLGIDMQSEPFTVVGIGDMSGDVFGNAMLRSEQIRLVAAFDHRDIFVDPDPDPAVSYQERARLFALARSSWQDYDRAKLSAGGGVWSRLEKRIVLSAQARAALRIEADELTAPDLIKAVLQAPVALLFTGGIGTFVRASTEPDHELDDRANADVRVEGSSIRARVVGEGANLALTQRARIEYARRGGHVNTDAIDNAAGVDISDHEVNIKILLRQAVEAGELTMAERDRLLVEITGDVVAAVLGDCALQSTALTRAQALSASRMVATATLIDELTVAGVVDRDVEALPTPAELQARRDAGAGLTRPELAVLLAGAKRCLTADLLASDMPDDPALRDVLVSYFPASLVARVGERLDGHRLRRELVASVVANDVVNRMGATFVTRLANDTGRPHAMVVGAYWIARGVTEAPAHWAELERGAQPVDAHAARTAALPIVNDLLEALTRDYLRRGEAGAIGAVVSRDRPVILELVARIGSIGTPYRRRLRSRRTELLIDQGLEAAQAERTAALPEVEVGPDAADVARRTGRDVTGVAETMLSMAEALGLDRLADRLRAAVPEDRWGRAAWRGLMDDLDDLRRVASVRALEDRPGHAAPEAVIGFLGERSHALGEITRMLRDIEGEPQPSLDAVAVAVRAVRGAIG